MPTFDCYEPESVDEALGLVSRYGEDAKVLAGGQSLMVLIRQRLVSPSCLVSLHRTAGLNTITTAPDGISLGAMATYREVASSPVIYERYGALVEACKLVGPIPVQNAGTVGGSICHNAPGADVPPVLLALDAQAKVRGPKGERTIPLTDFFMGYFETALTPQELLVGIAVPPPPPNTVGAYIKFNYRLIDMSLVGVAVTLSLDQKNTCRHVRITLGGVTNVPFRAYRAEGLLEGQRLSHQAISEAAHVAAEERELISDLHCSAEYRKKVIPPVVRRAFRQAVAKAGVDLPAPVSP
ncbi:MAG: xanthine dehydrogenase family protein subunit M [Chloroflexi bacterium]|nr:xanthine dehydrogenase family protein subunit M [Chloroflexota bacterium]